MGRTKEYYHDEIEDGSRRHPMEEEEERPSNKLSFIININANTVDEVETLISLMLEKIKLGHTDSIEVIKKPENVSIFYGYRRIGKF